MAADSPNYEVNLRPVFALGFLAAGAPTALLIALRRGTSAVWHGAAGQAVLGISSAVICIVIATWLARECRISGHPALAVLSDGFIGTAIIYTLTALVEDPAHMVALRVFSMLWALSYGSLSIGLLSWRILRRRSRALLGQHSVIFHAFQFVCFCMFGALVVTADQAFFHQPADSAALRLSIFVVAGSAIAVLLVASVRIYLKKRNPVILFFTQGLYLHTLAILGQTANPEWSLPWWFSQALGPISVFAIAYGVVEANRVRDRWELIQTLAARSDELQRSHENLVDSEARYRSLVDNAPYGIFRLNSSERFEAVNRAFLEILGLPLDTSLRKLPSCAAVFRTRDDYENFMLELRETGRVQQELFLKGNDGKLVKVRLECRRVSDAISLGAIYEGMIEDLREQSSLEEQLRHSQKMEAIGRLAGGVAHDFNNLLTIISGYTAMLMDTLAEQDPRRADAERVRSASQRAAALTRQLLAFSRKQVLSPAILDLNEIVADFSRMLPRLLGEDIDLAFMPSRESSLAYADRGQVEQVLMNLVVNARDAMPEGGKITIELKHEKLDRRDLRRRRGMNAGEYVMLAVTDTGCGMDAATQGRIFEPFFTTKPEGKGTGLGLATVYGIVKQSGGHISVYSEPGQGSTFKVYFPATEARRRTEVVPLPQPRPAKGETLLVVEDESDLREMIVRGLERTGYRVLQAGDGEQALDIAARCPARIDLLITDVVMSRMRGTQVAQVLCEMVPDMKVIYMSGYTENAMFHQNLLKAGVAFIQKPFTLEGLQEKVAQMLEGKAAFATTRP